MLYDGLIINNQPGRAAMQALESTESARNAVKRIHYTHDAMIDLIITKPDISGRELADFFGYSEPWISRVVCSDAFNARLAERRTKDVEPIIHSFEERLKGLASQSLDVLVEKLEATKNVDVALKCLELGTKALGYGARQTNVAVQTNFVVALPQKADSPQDWAKNYSPAIDVATVSN